MARVYKRDSRGRFASGGGGGGKPKATGGTLAARSSARRSRQKLGTMDSGNQSLSGNLSRRAQKAAVTRTGNALKASKAANRQQIKSRVAGTISKTRRQPAVTPTTVMAQPAKPPRMTDTLRGTLRALAQADAARIRQIESITGQPLRAPKTSKAGTAARARVQNVAAGSGSVTQTLRASLRELAQSDARFIRDLADATGPRKLSGSSSKRRRQLPGS